jgi:TolB-like protein/Flp pilus assembly protein TadD
MEVLVCLAEHPGEPVSKEKLLQTVWADTFVGDSVLTRSISELRRVFEDEAKEPRVIQTIAKRGYRLVAPVTPVNGTLTALSLAVLEVPRENSRANTRRWMWRLAIPTSAVLLLGVLLALNAGNLRARLWARTSIPQIHSLAVLPLKNLSGDPAQDYFAAGMTDELITYLSQIGGLRVISYTSIHSYKETKKTVPEIARELNVDAVVEGSVQRAGDRVRVNAQLIYAPQETHLWAQSYDRDLQDALALQSTVARAIADGIRVETTPGERERLQEPRPVNQAALEAYLQGKHYEDSVGEGSSFEEGYKAAAYYRDAIRQDPTFARAYVGLARAHIHFVSPPPKDAVIVKDALEKAIALDPNLAEAHLWMARFKQLHDWDFSGAEQEFRRAIELDPNNAGAHDFYGWFLDTQGRLDEGDREERRAQELDPGQDHLTDGYNVRGQYDRVLEISLRMVALHPKLGEVHHYLYAAYLHNGRYGEALPELQQTVICYGHPELAVPLAQAYDKGGIRAMLRLWAKDLENLQSAGVPPVFVANVYAQLGDADNAFKWLEKGYVERDGFLVDLNVNPDWKQLRSDPRFKDLVRRVGLPQ